jgi:hypothetical protein
MWRLIDQSGGSQELKLPKEQIPIGINNQYAMGIPLSPAAIPNFKTELTPVKKNRQFPKIDRIVTARGLNCD